MNPDMFLLRCLCLILIPKFRRLILVIPFEIFIPRTEYSFLRADTMLVSSDSKVQGLKSVFGDGLFQSNGLEFITTLELSCFGADTFVDCFLVLGNNQLQVLQFGIFTSELVDFFKLVCGVDMDYRKGYPAEKGFSDKPEQGSGILADRPEHCHVPELAVGFPDYEKCTGSLFRWFLGNIVVALSTMGSL